MLADYPLAGRDRSDLRQGLRGSTVGRYIIFYDPIEHGILISRIVYGGRDLPTLFGEEAADDA
jgi:plasmid stabilization system protein ParE